MVDLHSGTTISSSGGMNPQIRFGEDLMSRVSYVMMNPGGEDDLSKAVQIGIEDLIKQAAKNAALFFKHNGVLVREMNVYNLPNYIRVSLGTEEENNYFLKLLKKFIIQNDNR